jgi:Ca2+-binding RTX toxin-like protein
MDDYGSYDADPGDVDQLVATGTGSAVSFTDPGGITASAASMLPGQGDCVQDNLTTIHCAYSYFNLDLGDKNDTFTYAGGAFPVSSNFPQQFVVAGGAGSDTINGSPYSDDLRGDSTSGPDPSGNDTVLGNAGRDLIGDTDGTANTLDGGAGPDNITDGGTGVDTLRGGPDNDVVSGGLGPETLTGGDGDDDLNGGGGADNVLGEGGNDSVEGGADQDVADGGPGADVLSKQFHAGGCTLAPKLDGGPDTLIGGPGTDSVAVSCNTPILKLRDGEADKGSCATRVDSAVKEYDKADKIEGGACATLVCKKKKKKKAKKSSASAAKKGKKKKKKCKPYKAPQDSGDGFALALGSGIGVTPTRP